ncbi:MAG: glycoside hydrolase family 88 protein [Anaerolineae bacterium]|nr:glycoside hydrolase family 88 protein [Anaerolineae bacterium]
MTYPATLTQAFDIIRRTIPKMGTDRPAIGRGDLTYERCHNSHWVDGFWSGQLWLVYDETQDAVFMDAARAQRPYFIERLDRPESHDHDLGFLYSLSLVADYKLTGDEQARQGALRAADFLMGRYNPNGRFIRAWNDWENSAKNRGRMIIDSLENLGLLFWAAEQTGNPRYTDIAVAHAHTTVDYIVRADGSSYHSFHFDPESGEPLRGETVQGYADESCWSRGQSWGIHGFALTYRYTGDVRFRDTAVKLADYALARLPDDNVPYWDYLLPDDETPYRDTAAGVIMAAGLFLLVDQLDDAANAERYRDSARAMLDGLIAGYTTFDYPHAEGLLTQGASHVEKGYANNMLPYGDYFFIEALLRALGRTAFFW